MAEWFIDLVAGDDATGDGTMGNPYLTIDKAYSVGSSGDVFKLAKTGAHTNVSANFTFTVDSVTVTANADVTGDLAVGDYIGTPNMTGNGENIHAPYRINAISYSAPTTTITLETKYYNGLNTYVSPSAATEVVAYVQKLTFVTTGGAGATAVTTSKIATISGGWNFTSGLRDGYTWMTDNNVRTLATYEFFDVNNTTTLEYINIIDTYWITDNTGSTMTWSNCTLCPYGGAWVQAANGVITWNNILFKSYGAASYPIIRQTSNQFTVTDSWILYGGASRPIYSAGNISYDNVNFYGISNCNQAADFDSYTYVFDDCEYWHCANVFYDIISNIRLDSIKFYLCGTCFKSTNTEGGDLFKDCEFYGTTSTAIYVYQSTNTVVDSCVFKDNKYDIYLDQYSGNVTLTNCTHENPTDYSVYGNQGCGTIHINSPTLNGDLLTSGKFLYNPTVSQWNSFPRYTIQGIDTYYYPDGNYYGYFTIAKGSIVHSAYPSMTVQNKATKTTYSMSVPIAATYTTSGNGKKFKIYLKFNEGWDGTIGIEAKLNSSIIKTFTSLIPATISTSWVEHEFDIEDEYITQDGVLEICIINNGNTVLWSYDDIRVEDI